MPLCLLTSTTTSSKTISTLSASPAQTNKITVCQLKSYFWEWTIHRAQSAHFTRPDWLHSQPKVRSCKFDSRFPLSVSLTHVFDLRIGLGLHFISSWFSLFYSKLKSLYFDFTHNTSLLCIYEHTVFTRIRAVALI